ncbi:MAG: YhdH/YhfP family quinone oxidoreductase [Bacteroidales bacterium]|nr:YhdH/YhfP family quinone oxidoreductase [Bacteroidales bacterium]
MVYKALLTEESSEGFKSVVTMLNSDDFLPEGEVLVRVHYSSLNYKDALSATGNKGVTKHYPHTPGIDAAGVVEESSVPEVEVGRKVIVTGFDLGMNTPGGMGQLIRVPASWIVALPDELSLKEAMIFGTAGFTAAISVGKLRDKIQPADGPVLVSGATGGVGSMAVAMLAQLGYQVHAISGKESESEFLTAIGASRVLPRSEFQEPNPKPLLPGRFAGAIDTVGGEILVNMIKSVQQDGLVTTCGSVSSTSLQLNVFPFILRAVSLVGISAQNYPAGLRPALWKQLAGEFKPGQLLKMYNEIRLDEVPAAVEEILKGKLKGRTIINLLQ